MAVIQHHAAPIDVKLAVDVARNAGGAGRLDVDERDTISGREYGRPLAGRRSIKPKDLAEYEFISREPGSGTREITDDYFRTHQVPPENLKTQMELGSPEALKGVVATGLGAVRAAAMPRKMEVIRTGTDNVSMEIDYGNLELPAVIRRTSRTTVEAMSANGMSTLDIPAFLRKQAD